VFDRKSIADLYGTYVKGYPRFKKCIIRAQESKTTLFVIVEGTFTEVMKGYKHSQVSPISMVRKIFTLWIRHGVQTIFTKDRKEMAQFITNFYIGVGRERFERKE